MFGIGVSELVIIALVVIIFIRPKDYPEFFRKAGRAWAKIKKTMKEVTAIKDEFVKQIDEVAKLDVEPELPGKAAEPGVKAEAAALVDVQRQGGAPKTGGDGSPADPEKDAPSAEPNESRKPVEPPAPEPGLPPRDRQPEPLASFDASVATSGGGYTGALAPSKPDNKK
jgi:Sec-independent protein translocase protein TatA